MTERPGRPADPDAAVLAPREEAALAESVRPVGGRGRGASLAALLIVVAFVVGVVRPWDYLPTGGSGRSRPVPDGSFAAVGDTSGVGDVGTDPDAAVSSGIAPAPTCGYPR